MDSEKTITLTAQKLQNRLKRATELGRGEAVAELLQKLDVDSVEVLFKAVEEYRKPKQSTGRSDRAQVTDEDGESHSAQVEIEQPIKSKMGRPTLCTPELTQEICALIERGNLPEDAAILSGINRSTYYDWSKNNADFSDEVQKAQAKFKQRRLLAIQAAGYRIRKMPDGSEKASGAWQADAWLNERMFPQQFGQQLVIRVQGEDAAILKKQQLTALQVWELVTREIAMAVQLNIDWLQMIEGRLQNMSSGNEHLALPGIIINLDGNDETSSENT